MTNPFRCNDEAADLVAFYGSRNMVASATNRLYYEGVKKHEEHLQRCDIDYYPPRFSTRRSKKEIDRYLQKSVDETLRKRHEKITELRTELDACRSMRFVSTEQLREHIKEIYTEDVQKRRAHKEDAQKMALYTETNNNKFISENEKSWKPPGVFVHRNDLFLEVPSGGFKTSRNKSPEEIQLRCTELSHPLRVTPKYIPSPPSGFTVYTKKYQGSKK